MAYENSQSYSGQGTKIEVCLFTTSPISFQDAGEVMSFSPAGKWEMDDPTNLKSTVREKKPVLFDAGGMKTTVNRVTTNPGQQILADAYRNKKLLRVKVTLAPNTEIGQTTGDVLQYLGYCTQNDPDVQVAKRIVNQFEIAFTAFVSETAGS